jgi:hypothetical protein
VDTAIQAPPDPARLLAPLQCLQAIARAAHSIRTPQFVLLMSSNQEPFTPEFLAEASRVAYNLKASFHVVASGGTEADPAILTLCQKSAGLYLQFSDGQLPQLLADLALGLTGSYRVRLEAATGALKLQVFSEQGCGSVQLD